MKCLDCYRMNLVIVGFMAALIIIDGERASAEFMLGEPVNLGSPTRASSEDQWLPAANLGSKINSSE